MNPYSLKFEEKKPCASASGTDYGWTVEVRMKPFSSPMIVNSKQVIGHQWMELPTVASPSGVRNSKGGSTVSWAGLYTYEAAEALRHWFLADVAADDLAGSIGVETRLVCYKIKYNRECYRQIFEEEKDDA